MDNFNNLHVLILDDDEFIRTSIQEFLKTISIKAYAADRPSAAFELLKDEPVDIIILDLKLPESDGITVLNQVKKDYPGIEVIMITGQGDNDAILRAMRGGAFDFFSKPVSLVDIQGAIERTAKYMQLAEKLEDANATCSLISGELKANMPDIIGESESIREAISLTLKGAASRDTSILLAGESGTGKDLFARAIHYASERKDGYFYTLNCSAIPETLIESELFGHTKGAFTGAAENKKGAFEYANGGTLFLDEIGDMPLSGQAKLLRLLEDRTVRPVGSNIQKKIDVRIICATNKNLKELVDQGSFRLDLLYRLNTITITIPTLSDRPEDIPLLVDYYVRRMAQSLKRDIAGVTDEVYDQLKSYSFPGNVRELKNMIERAILLCDGNTLTPNAFDTKSSPLPEAVPEQPRSYSLKNIEIATIKAALSAARENQTETARLLDISRFALLRKIEKYNLK